VESYRTEEEQVEALKRWWKENGTSTLVSILLAVAVAFGWQGWQARQQARAEAASNLYQQFLETLGAAGQGSAGAEAEKLATRIATEYDGTAYARFAELHLARLHVADGDLGAAEAALRTVLAETSPKEDLHRVAKLRLGRILAARGDTEDALALLAGDPANPYAGAYAMARGDVLLAAGRDSEAVAAYREAQSLADPERPLPGLAEKLDYLNPQPPTAGAQG
jgi:predicted negative regulator of RcsB-dependent stress response